MQHMHAYRTVPQFNATIHPYNVSLRIHLHIHVTNTQQTRHKYTTPYFNLLEQLDTHIPQYDYNIATQYTPAIHFTQASYPTTPDHTCRQRCSISNLLRRNRRLIQRPRWLQRVFFTACCTHHTLRNPKSPSFFLGRGVLAHVFVVTVEVFGLGKGVGPEGGHFGGLAAGVG